jgi:uncharacterized protein (TIGR02117 family)
MKKIIRYSGLALATLIAAILLYASAALVLGVLPVNREFREPGDGIAIYLRTNDVHADIILPTRTVERDWSRILEVPGIAHSQYVSIGWGDRAFYLETKNWGDLHAGNALRALIGIDESVMHVSAENKPRESDTVQRIRINRQQLQQLIAQIDASFTRNPLGAPQQIAGIHYSDNDGFYEAQGHYSMFKTCNEWVRVLLSNAGVRTANWSPFTVGLRYQARKIHEMQSSK